MTALLLQSLFAIALLGQAPPPPSTSSNTTSSTAQPDQVTPNTPAPAPAPSPAPASDAPQSSTPSKIPWKTITKVGSQVAYLVWVGLWVVTVPLGALGTVLLGLSAGGGNTGMVAGGALLMVAAVALFTIGLVGAGVGAGLGVASTVMQLLNPDDQAADATLSMFLPRTLLL